MVATWRLQAPVRRLRARWHEHPVLVIASGNELFGLPASSDPQKGRRCRSGEVCVAGGRIAHQGYEEPERPLHIRLPERTVCCDVMAVDGVSA